MNEMIEFFKNNLFPVVSSVVAVITVYLTALSLGHQKKSSCAKERLDNVISPIFEIIEPYMCPLAGLPTNESLNGIKHIFNENRLLAGATIRKYLAILQSEEAIRKNPKSFDKLCAEISREYDSLCKEIGIPCRSLKYRFFTYKLKFAWKYIFVIFFLAIFQIAIATFCFLVLIGIAVFAKILFDQGNYTEALIIAIPLGVVVSCCGYWSFRIDKST